jgi:hypothetical protein
VVVDVGLPTVLLGDVLVRDVRVLDLGMVVLVRVRGEEMDPVLPTMVVMGHVVVLLPVHHGFVMMTTLGRPAHPYLPRPGALTVH